MADMGRSLDLALTQIEAKVLELLQNDWQNVGNIKVKTFARMRLLVTVNERDFLPAIVVHATPLSFFNTLGGFIPVVQLTVWGIVPYVGTAEQRLALEAMASRIAGILLNHFKVENHWSDLRLRDVRVLNDNEQPPRWEACQVRAEVWGLPVSFW